MQAQNSRSQKPTLQAPEPREGFKETVESIVVAFILAFVFRAFVVEAFVIPTGSMAATLYGKHGTLVCEDCGWENVYGLTDQTTRAARFGPNARVLCQNCNWENTDLMIHDGLAGRRGQGGSVGGNAESGDRILVFKWPLNMGFEAFGPKRWDVTVFKNPARGDENFIKRLMGLPNEVLEIIDGDVFTVPTAELSEDTLRILEERRKIKYRKRTDQNVGHAGVQRLRRPPPASVLDELAEKLRICRKTVEAQKPLWVVVYDHDYPPRSRATGQPFWKPEPGSGPTWNTENRRLTFQGASGGSGTARFAGKPIVDHNAYNIDVPPRIWNPVSDLRLEAVLYFKGGDGYVEFLLPKRDDVFAMRLDADGHVSLRHRTRDDGEATVLAETLVAPLEPGRAVELAFQVVDYRVSIEVDRREILATTDEMFAPDIKRLRETPAPPTAGLRIMARDIDLELWHIALFRDEYYSAPKFGKTRGSVWNQTGWGTANNPILLREDEYFMLGDNSPASKDSRLWDEVGAHLRNRGEDYQMGTVPEDQIVGRAFFVYWPSGLRPEWIPGIGSYGVVPNVGRMRWIR